MNKTEKNSFDVHGFVDIKLHMQFNVFQFYVVFKLQLYHSPQQTNPTDVSGEPE